MNDMSAPAEMTNPTAKAQQGPAVKLSTDVHRAIGLRKLRCGGRIQDMVDAALREAFARELGELKADQTDYALEIVK